MGNVFARCVPQVVEARLSRSVPACAFGLLLFRFEGAALRPGLFVQAGRVGRIPGDVLAGLLIRVAARVLLCRMLPSLSPRELLVSSGVGCGACVVSR